MARARASDHDDKRQAILDHAAALFARHGYDRASLSMLAQACGMSKALLYHYYADKAQLLFDIIRTHLEHLLAATAEPDGMAEDPRARAQWLARALLDAYRRADACHQIQIGQMQLLPEPQQRVLKDMERALVVRFAAAIAACLPPAHDPALVKPLTMSLFGMLNWHYLWFREDGPLTRDAYATFAVTLVIEGAEGLRPPMADAAATLVAAPNRSRSQRAISPGA